MMNIQRIPKDDPRRNILQNIPFVIYNQKTNDTFVALHILDKRYSFYYNFQQQNKYVYVDNTEIFVYQ